MSAHERRNIPHGVVMGRRELVVRAAAIAVGCGALGVGVCEVVAAKRSENLELYVESSISDERAEQLAERLRTTFRNVNLTMFTVEEMDSDAWKSLAARDKSWLVFGANEQGTAALVELDCHDWTGDAKEIGDTLAFSFDEDVTMHAFPVEGSLGMLLCNMDLLNSVGAGTASDVDGLMEVCAYLTESGIEPLALERVVADSASVGLALDAALAYWASDGVPQPESVDKATSLLAASILRCGRRTDGASSAEMREDAISLFKEGKAAMIFVSSVELGLLEDLDFPCLSLSIPSLSSEGMSVFRPVKSVVCSSNLPDRACSSVLEWLSGDAAAGVTGAMGSVASVTDEEGGIVIKDLPNSVLLGMGPVVLLDGNELEDAERQSYCEKIAAIWGQDEIDRITYAEEMEVEA